MRANNSKSYLGYLNNLVDRYNNTYHHSTGEKPIYADYSALTEKLNQVKGDRVRITKYKNICSKSYTENWSKEIFVIDCV